MKYVKEMRSKFTLKMTFTAMLTMQSKKQKQTSACLQLIKIKMKAIRHWVPVVGWLSERCRLVARRR